MKRWLFTLLIVIFAAIFLISAWFLGDYFLASYRQTSQHNELSQIMHEAAGEPTQPEGILSIFTPKEDTSPDPTQPAEPELVAVTDPETGEEVMVLQEFAQLYQMNNDLVGWISIYDTKIDYPVVQSPEYTDYYLYRDFNKNYSNHGSIYVREVCDVFAPSDNLTIYGHRMGDGTMFNALHDYASWDFFDQHRYITFNTLQQRRTYEIMAVFRISSTADNPFQYHLFVDAASEVEFDEYVENCLSRSIYDTGVTAAYGDKLITLSTCEYTNLNGRLVVVAKQIQDEE